MKEIILDNCTKELLLWTSAPVIDEAHITTHYKDHYTSVYQEGNWHGFSTGITPVQIVESPPCGTCKKRIVSSISVYNPSDDPITIFVAENDPASGIETIIVERIIEPNETWTMECICTCCEPGASGTLGWTGCTGPTPYLLSLGSSIVDLSCLAGGSGVDLSVYQDGALVNLTTGINFQDCLEATWDSVNNWVNVTLNPTLAYDCDTSLLTVCGNDVDLRCEVYMYGYLNMSNATPSVQVMNNGVILLTNTNNLILPIIPVTAYNVRVNGAVFYVHNYGPNPATITAAAGVIITNNPGTIAVDETIPFLIRHIGGSTTYFKIS